MKLKKLKKLKIKKAKLGDLRATTRLLRLIYKDIPQERVAKWISESKVYVLKDKKKIKAAFSFTIFGTIGLFSLMYVYKIAVDPSLQGQGVGTYLLNEIRKKSIKLGVSVFALYSFKQTMKFYEKAKLSRFWRFFYWRNPAV